VLRRFGFAALAAALVAPVVITTPAHAPVLFSCSAASGTGSFSPGLGHAPTAQTWAAAIDISGCSNTHTGTVLAGIEPFGLSPITSYASRPLGCPEELGGAAGNNYPDQTPILVGAAGDSFHIVWSPGPDSFGIAKLKASASYSQWKLVFSISAGKFAPPSGQKTRMKGSLSWTPGDSFDCTGDSNRIGSFDLVLPTGGSLIVKQE
jgi:hypothetical protein